jgi:hypothetical protein
MNVLLALAPAALVATLQGCGSTQAQAAASGAASATAASVPGVPLRTVALASAACVRRGRTDAVLRDVAAWDAWQRSMSCDGTPRGQAVDFGREAVLAADGEDGPNGCHALRIVSVRRDGARAVVRVERYVPPPDAVCTSMLVHPYHAVAVPQDVVAGEVAFEWVTVTGRPAP